MEAVWSWRSRVFIKQNGLEDIIMWLLPIIFIVYLRKNMKKFGFDPLTELKNEWTFLVVYAVEK